MGICRISIDWIMRGASFICWLMRMCCEVSNRMSWKTENAKTENWKERSQ
jgi:hypothetical protein